MELGKQVARQQTNDFKSFVRSIRHSLNVTVTLAEDIAAHCYPTVLAKTEKCSSSKVMVRVMSGRGKVSKVRDASFGMTLKTDQNGSFTNHYIKIIEEGSAAEACGLLNGDELIALNEDFLGRMKHIGVIETFHHIILGYDKTQFAMVIRRNSGPNFELMKISFDLEIEDTIGTAELYELVPNGVRIFGSSFNYIIRNKQLLKETVIWNKTWDCKILAGPEKTAELYWTCKNQEIHLTKAPSSECEAIFKVHSCKANVTTGGISQIKTVSIFTFENCISAEESTVTIGNLGKVFLKKEHLEVDEHNVINAGIQEVFINHYTSDTGRQFAFESLGRQGSFLCQDGKKICLKRAECTDYLKKDSFQFFLV